jgi:hypothetical protein
MTSKQPIPAPSSANAVNVTTGTRSCGTGKAKAIIARDETTSALYATMPRW